MPLSALQCPRWYPMTKNDPAPNVHRSEIEKLSTSLASTSGPSSSPSPLPTHCGCPSRAGGWLLVWVCLPEPLAGLKPLWMEGLHLGLGLRGSRRQVRARQGGRDV